MHHHGVTGDRKVQQFPHETVSKLAPFSALIICVVLVILFLIRYYILESFLLRRVYGTVYTDLSELNRRGFLNHHIAGVTKILILIVAAYPFIDTVFGTATFKTPFVKGSPVMMGDLLIVVSQMLIAMYIFELIYRAKLSPVAVLHHVGTIMIGQSAIAIGLPSVDEKDADIEFLLCTVWGAFDIISEFLPHIAIILYRVYPKRHSFLRRLFLYSCITTASGTTMETIVTMYLFGSLWSQWTLPFKVVTPLLHLAFTAAQVHGSLVFYRMYRRQTKHLSAERHGDVVNEDIEEARERKPEKKLDSRESESRES